MSPHSVPQKTNSRSQASVCRNNIWGFYWAQSVPDGRRQTQGRHSSRTHTPTHTHTLTLTYAVSMGNLGTDKTVGLYGAADSTIPVSEPAGWLWRQDKWLYCPPGLLSTLPQGNSFLSSLVSLPSPCWATSTHDGQLKIQTGKAAALRSPLSPLTPSHLPRKAQGRTSLLFFSSAEDKVYTYLDLGLHPRWAHPHWSLWRPQHEPGTVWHIKHSRGMKRGKTSVVSDQWVHTLVVQNQFGNVKTWATQALESRQPTQSESAGAEAVVLSVLLVYHVYLSTFIHTDTLMLLYLSGGLQG